MEIEKSIEIMKSLADSSRLRVLNALMDKSQYVEELANRLNLAASTVSFHLKKLEKADLVYKTKNQYYITYHIKEEIFKKTLKELTSFDDIDKFVEEERIDKYREKVIKTFFKKNRLVQLPVQNKKRIIVLDQFIKKFKHGKTYEEFEVNEIIKESFDDYCIIRRLMIEEGMMERESQVYWLTEK